MTKEQVLVDKALSDTWELYFDGSCSQTRGYAAGVVFKNPTREQASYHQKLGCGLTCNHAKYSALITGLEIAKGKEITAIQINGDSKLVCNQVVGLWEVKSDKLLPLHQTAVDLVDQLALTTSLEAKIPRLITC